MDLCSSCNSITLEKLTSPLPEAQYFPHYGSGRPWIGMRLFPEFAALEESSQCCPLCHLIMQEHMKDDPHRFKLGRSEPVYIYPKKDDLGRTFPYRTAPGHFITGLNVVVRSDLETVYSTLRLFADTGMEE